MSINNSRYTLLVLISSFEYPEKIIEVLRKAMFVVITATDLDEVIHTASVKPPDLIILNIEQSAEKKFPVQKLRKNKYTQDIFLLFIATITANTCLPNCLLSDNIDFISKPFRSKELIVRIQHQLSLMEARRIIRLQNQKLCKTIESRDKLYSVIAHDLRAPISTIKMINSTLEKKREQISDPQIRKLFDMISETTEEAFNLLENLLRWSRNQNGKTRVFPTKFSITKAIRQVVSLFTTIASAKEIKLNNYSTEDVFVCADEDMIKTVLRNLISNAVKFSYPGGHIDISLHESQDVVIVSVQDYGQGIKKELQSKLLKTNEYTTTYGTRNEKGSGLGLILCRDFIKMNKGKLWFTSQENKGTTFYFTLSKHPVSLESS